MAEGRLSSSQLTLESDLVLIIMSPMPCAIFLSLLLVSFSPDLGIILESSLEMLSGSYVVLQMKPGSVTCKTSVNLSSVSLPFTQSTSMFCDYGASYTFSGAS